MLVVAYISIIFSSLLLTSSFLLIIKKAINNFYRKYEHAVSATLDEIALSIPPQYILLSHILLGAIGFILGIAIGGKYVLPIIIFTVGFAAIPTVVLRILKKRRQEKFEAQFADAMRALANSLKSGLSIMQALDFIVKQYGPPFSTEFYPVLREVMLGVPFEKALENLAMRVKSEDVDIFATAVAVSKSVGGSLSDILADLADFIVNRRNFRKKVKAITAEARGQAIMLGALPWLVALALYFVDPETYSTLFSHWLGWVAIGAVIILELVGFYFLRKIMQIDY